MNGYGEINVKRSIDRGERAGPWIDATAPYLEGPGLNLPQVHELTDAADARRLVDFWTDMGATSLKAYMHITRDELKAAIDEGHKRGMKLTGHLCSVTYREAAELGIDNLEHGFFASTDFVADKKPDVCPGQGVGQASIAAVDTAGAPFKSLIAELVKRHVALTSTLTVFETFTPGRPDAAGARRARARAARAVRDALQGRADELAVDLRHALSEGARAGDRLPSRRRAARRRHRSNRRRRRDSGILGPARRSSCSSRAGSRRSRRSRSAR